MSAVTPPELLCINCGYDLRGLDRTGNCPECGRQVMDSVRARRLMGADYRWLTRITIGQWLVSRGLFGIAFALVLVFASLMIVLPSAINRQTDLLGCSLVASLILASCSVVAIIAGALLLSGKSLDSEWLESTWTARRRVRTFLLGAFACLGSVIWIGIASGKVPPLFFWMVFLGMVVLASVASASLLQVLESLAIRMPHRRLARQTRGVSITCLWLPSAFVCGIFLASLMSGSSGSPLIAVAGLGVVLALIAGIGLLFLLGTLILLMNAYLRLLRKCRLRAYHREVKAGTITPDERIE